MEIRLLLWVYLLSAGSVAALLGRRRAIDRWFLAVVLLIAAVSGVGLAVERARAPAFYAATAGFVLFLILPGVLVRVARRGALRGRFATAGALVHVATGLLPSDALRRERDIYRGIHAGGGETHPAAAELRQRLRSPAGDASRAPVCGLFAAALVLCHLLVSLAGDTDSLLTLMEFGANRGELVRAGQVYRLLTAVFLHMGLLHLGLNVMAIWVLGKWVEPAIGRPATVVVILLSGIVGNVASVLFYGANGITSVGASGAAMGLIGAATALRLGRGGDGSRQLSALLLVIGATLFLGVVEPFIDNGAHLGGLAAGFVLGVALRRAPVLGRWPARSGAVLLAIALVLSVVALIRDLPRWRSHEPFRGPGFSFSRPSFLEQGAPGPVWTFKGLAGGDLSVTVEPAPEDARAFLLERLGEIAREVRGDEAGVAVRVEGPGPAEIDGPDLVGRVVATSEQGELKIDVYLYLDPDSPRVAVLTFWLPTRDAVQRRRTLPVVLDSFRFERGGR